jgi:hypothetical protein
MLGDKHILRSGAELLFVVLLAMGPIALNVIGWWQFAHLSSEPWRRRVSAFGLVANSAAVAIPWGMFLYNYTTLNYTHRPLALREDLLVNFAIALAVISVVSGVVSSRAIRWPLVCGGVLAGLFWFVIPRGV